MMVRHTKFRPDEGFETIRTHINSRADVLSIHEVEVAIEERSK